MTERLTQKSRALETVAPGMIHRLSDADARTDGDRDVLRAGKEREWRLVQCQSIVRVGDAERLAQASRTRAKESLVGDTAAAAHRGETKRGRERADQHRAGNAFRLAHEVDAPMNAVGAVDIGVTGRAEHHGVARGLAAEAVRGGIALVIGLDLDD